MSGVMGVATACAGQASAGSSSVRVAITMTARNVLIICLRGSPQIGVVRHLVRMKEHARLAVHARQRSSGSSEYGKACDGLAASVPLREPVRQYQSVTRTVTRSVTSDATAGAVALRVARNVCTALSKMTRPT